MAGDEVATRPRPRSTEDATGRAYEADVHGWATDQARHIRAGRYDLVDVTNVAEEIEALGRHEFNVLARNLEIVLLHMLKWDHQGERRSRSWALSIAEHRRRVAVTLIQNPSLAPRREEAMLQAYDLARLRAAAEVDLPLRLFPERIPYTWTDVVERPFVHVFE